MGAETNERMLTIAIDTAKGTHQFMSRSGRRCHYLSGGAISTLERSTFALAR
jgi:hypothetical protein